MIRDIRIAFFSYLASLASSRATRRASILAILLLLAVCAGRFSGLLPPATFSDIAAFVILPGVPLFAVLLSEMTLRDGLGNRTLLYPLLGPVSRGRLATVRTIATGLLLFLGAALLLAVVKALGGLAFTNYPRELLAMLLGSLAYVAIFGFIHLLSNKALIISLGLYAILDEPFGRLPFTLRNLAPSYHLRVLADKIDSMPIPVAIETAGASIPISTVVLIALLLIFGGLTALLFSRKNLVSLC